MCCCFGTINTSDVGIIESFGKYSRTSEAGCFCFLPPIEYLAGKISLRLQQLNCNLESKTKDNVFVNVNVAVQYQVVKTLVYKAFYTLENHQQSMRAYIFDTVRSELTKLTLDHAFASKEEISLSIKQHLSDEMKKYGYEIITALVTDMVPDMSVRNAMNEINAAKRQKEAAYQRAEGEKIIKVKAAEANSDSMYLAGVGVANQRKAIMGGLKDSIKDFSEGVNDANIQEVMDLLVLNQYFDTLTDMATNPNIKIVFTEGDMPVRTGLLEAKAS